MLNVNYNKINGYVWFVGTKSSIKNGQSVAEEIEVKVPLYEANCLGACVQRTNKDDKLIWWCNDLAHLKNMLGLTNNFDNSLSGWITKVELLKSYKSGYRGGGTAVSICNAFSKAGIPCTLI